MDARYKPEFFKQLSKKAFQIPCVAHTINAGFIKFIDDNLHSYYLQVIYDNNVSGFIKYNKDLTFNSAYIGKGKEEHRYDKDGNLVCKYIHKQKGDELIVEQIKDKEKKTIEIKGQAKRFPKLYKKIENKIEKDNDKFKYFTKDNGTYLFIRRLR